MVEVLKANCLIIIKKIYRNFFYPIKKIAIVCQKKVIFDIGSYFDRRTIFAGKNYLGMNTFLSESSVGYASYIADYSVVFNTRIGKYSSIGSGVMTAVGRHPINENISTSPSFFSLYPKTALCYCKEQVFCERKNIDASGGYSIVIGNDVWIGNRVTILEGVTIGDGAIIGAGSVVTGDVEPYSINVGVPSKKIGDRFGSEVVNRLLKLEWWNKDEEWLKKHVEEFCKPEMFNSINLK